MRVCARVCVGHLTLAQLCDSFLANGAITHARLSCESSRLYAIKIFTRHRQRGQLCESSLLATHTHTCIHALTGGCKFRQNAVAYFFAHYCTRFPSLLHLHADGKRGKCSALTHFTTYYTVYIYSIYIYIYINIRLKCTRRKQPKNHSGPQQRNEYKRKLNMQNEQKKERKRGERGKDRE